MESKDGAAYPCLFAQSADFHPLTLLLHETFISTFKYCKMLQEQGLRSKMRAGGRRQ